VGIVEVVEREAQLLHVVLALRPRRGVHSFSNFRI
jgi:hypothetical protein